MISVIIPMYNAEKTISACIESVLSQTYTDFEVIVVDDGSIDSSVNKVKYYVERNKNKVRLVKKENGGVSTARNEGIRQSQGDYIAFLDADDYWFPQKLEKQIDKLDEDENIVFIGCNRNNEEYKKELPYLFKLSLRNILIKMYPQTSTAIIKKSILNKLNGYDENMTHAEDGDLWVRIAYHYPIYIVNETLVITGNGKLNFGVSGLSANLTKMNEGNLFLLKKAYNNKFINIGEYTIFLIYYQLKYLRRKFIVKSNIDG